MEEKHVIMWLESTDSTNEEAKRRISVIDNLSVLAAIEQTSGKGQGEHTWTSAAGENLTFSIVLKPEGIKAKDSFRVSKITALSVVDFLSGYNIDALIKWPNDIYVLGRKDGKKICGILIENIFKGDMLSVSILGIGININQTDFPTNLPNPVSLACLTGKKHSIEKCLEEFMDRFRNIYENESPQSIDSRYNSLMFKI